MLVVFRDFQLPPIPQVSSNLREADIKKWKGNQAVKTCFEKLFKRIRNSEPETYMSKIIQTLRKRKKVTSKAQMAYAISICETLLNPKNLHIQISESVIKPILAKNFVII